MALSAYLRVLPNHAVSVSVLKEIKQFLDEKSLLLLAWTRDTSRTMASAEEKGRLAKKRPLDELRSPRSMQNSTDLFNLSASDSNVHESASGTDAGNKRRRTALACSACRTRKTRCDGGRPSCSACETLGFQCVYAQAAFSNDVVVAKEHLFTFESRLSILEHKFKNFEQGTSRRAPPQSQSLVDPMDVIWQGQDVTSEIGEDQLAPAVFGLNDPTDAMGAMIFTEEEDFGFFGPSSNIAFTRHISQAVARVTQSRQTWTTPGTEESLRFAGRMTRDSGPASPVRRPQGIEHGKPKTVDIYFVPAEAEIRRLMKSYFDYIGSLYPYVHEATFSRTYEETRRNNFKEVRRTWLALFNMVLALATGVPYNSDVTVQQRTERADVFYQRAMILCKEQMTRGTSLEVVQFLLLVVQHLQGTRQSLQTWTVHGLAVKAALQLGLHSNEALKRFSPLDREIRKRTWYACVVLDRVLSMTFGRPSTIHEDYVRADLPSNYPESLPTTTLTSASETVSLEFFNATIILYRIMWKVIHLLYGGNLGSDDQTDVFDNITNLFSLEKQLTEWKGSLPPSLTVRESWELSKHREENLPVWERSRVVLTLRYHNVRILVHRPILVRFLDLAGTENQDEQYVALLQQVGFNSVQTCVQAASEIVGLVNLVVHSTGVQRKFLGAWWFTIYYSTYRLDLICSLLSS